MSHKGNGQRQHGSGTKLCFALTGRETQVLRQLLDGETNTEIALKLGITVKTVEFHVSKLLRKYGVDSRFELMGRLPPKSNCLDEESEDRCDLCGAELSANVLDREGGELR